MNRTDFRIPHVTNQIPMPSECYVKQMMTICLGLDFCLVKLLGQSGIGVPIRSVVKELEEFRIIKGSSIIFNIVIYRRLSIFPFHENNLSVFQRMVFFIVFF